ncbi:MAG: hypothetical protein V4697_02660 [Patescibacteria group bacterium]
MKKLIIIVLILGIIIGAFFAFNSYIYNEKQAPVATDYKETEFFLDGARATIGGDIQYFGNELAIDLDLDGVEDKIFLITYSPGGSGTFYYVVGAVKTSDGYVGTDAVLLGDRIAPQTTEPGVHPGIVVINYAERLPNEPFTTSPSHGKSLWLKLDVPSMRFGEVAVNFEGESNLPRE